MMYFKPKNKGCRVDFGRGRSIAIPMNMIVEVDYEQNKASVKAVTGAVMIYYSRGIMNMSDRDIAKLMANKNFSVSNSFNFVTI